MNQITKKLEELLSETTTYMNGWSGLQMRNHVESSLGKDFNFMGSVDYIEPYKTATGTVLESFYAVSVVQLNLYLWLKESNLGVKEDVDLMCAHLYVSQIKLRDKLESLKTNTPLKHIWIH